MAFNPLFLARKISSRLAQHGPIDTTRWLWSHIELRARERWLNIETESHVEAAKLDLGENCNHYEPISYTTFDTILDRLDISPARDCFLDIGCGKGRAVIMAATKPFKQVIGVELSEDLCKIAEENIKRAKPKLQCQAVEIVCTDATTYQIPENVNVIFLWNPFYGPVLDTVLENIRRSLLKAPRELTIFQGLPHREPDPMMGLDWLTDREMINAKFFTGIDIVRYKAEMTRSQSTENTAMKYAKAKQSHH
ncbi:MAG: class I SAM-dependent methyltransferase [Filomicrobium sp.]